MPLQALDILLHIDLIYLYLIKILVNFLFLNVSIFSGSEMVEKTGTWPCSVKRILWYTMLTGPSKEWERLFVEIDLIVCTIIVLRSSSWSYTSSKVAKKLYIGILKWLSYLASPNGNVFRLNIKKRYDWAFLQWFSSSILVALFWLDFEPFWRFVISIGTKRMRMIWFIRQFSSRNFGNHFLISKENLISELFCTWTSKYSSKIACVWISKFIITVSIITRRTGA